MGRKMQAVGQWLRTGEFSDSLKEEIGPSFSGQTPTEQTCQVLRDTIVSEVVSELDAEYPPMDSSFDYVTARRAAYLAIDKLLSRDDVIFQPDARGEA